MPTPILHDIGWFGVANDLGHAHSFGVTGKLDTTTTPANGLNEPTFPQLGHNFH